MIKFLSLDEFVLLTKMAQDSGMKNINCYLFPNEVEIMIEKGQISYLQSKTTFQVIVEYGRYFKVYFYGKDDFSFIDFVSKTKPIITDIAYSNVMREKDVLLKEKFEKMGFEVKSRSSRMKSQNFDFDIKNDDYKIEKMAADERKYVLEIWEENFDATNDLLYDADELWEKQDDVFVLKNKAENIVGVIEISQNSRAGFMQKLAIKKSAQGKGLGSYLESFYINYCKSLGFNNLLLYTIDDNFRAQNFHKKFGFDFDGKHNIQFIYRR